MHAPRCPPGRGLQEAAQEAKLESLEPARFRPMAASGGDGASGGGALDEPTTVGGFMHVAPDDPDVLEAAYFAAAEMTRSSKSSAETKLLEVVGGRKQVLGGTNYVLVLRVQTGLLPPRAEQVTVHRGMSGVMTLDESHPVAMRRL